MSIRRIVSDSRLLPTGQPPLAILLLFACLIIVYLLARFAGNWSEGDTIRMGGVVYSMVEGGAVLPQGSVYPHGFSSSAATTFLINLTGMPLDELTRLILPFLLVPNLLLAYALFTALTGERLVGCLSAFLLAIQPEFLFTVFRGSHEKFTMMLTILALFVLVRSFARNQKTSVLLVWILLFYLAAFGLITINLFFASSFLALLAVSFFALLGLFFVFREKNNQYSRLALVICSCLILVFVFVFYLYPPAVSAIWGLKTSVDKIAALLLNVDVLFDTTASSGSVQQGWVSVKTYMLLSSASWLVVLLSFVYWWFLTFDFIKRKSWDSRLFLLWLFYAGFALQVAVAVVFSGFGILASNLQVRLFPIFMLFAIPLATLSLKDVFRRINQPRLKILFTTLLFFFFAWFTVTSLLKTANEPLFSNNWIFRLREEQYSVDWVAEHTETGNVWVGLDRLRYSASGFRDPLKTRYDIYSVDGFVRYALISRFERTRMLRMGVAQPNLYLENLVYANGEVNFYHFRPRTAYQK